MAGLAARAELFNFSKWLVLNNIFHALRLRSGELIIVQARIRISRISAHRFTDTARKVRFWVDNGADYIVVGRPIRDADDPRAAAEGIQRTIAGVFA